MKIHHFMVVFLSLNLWSLARSPEPIDLQVITRIKEEAGNNSQVMNTLRYLSDVYGPRLTGSDNYKQAAEWCRDRLGEWGLQNAHLDSWGVFGIGWEVTRYRCEMTAPQYVNIFAHPKAWTAGTPGVVSGNPVLLDTETDDLESYKGQLAGKIVLLGKPEIPESVFEAEATVYSAEDLAELATAREPGKRPDNYDRIRKWRERRARREKIKNFLLDEDAVVVLEAGSLRHGTLRVHSGGSYKTTDSRSIPTLVTALEHYNRIARLVELEVPVSLEINIETRFLNDDSLGYNVIADLPGSDRRLKNEVVMIGAHLDSWHSGTGATDNAANCAVMMEVVRILQAIDARPRRTVRIALWSGEEQGLLGSKGYVRKYLANPDDMSLKPAHGNISAYYNLDNGAGKIRGIYLQENDAARPIMEAFLAPFADMGAATVTIRNTRSTDHISFDAVGIPGFQFIQDPLDYYSRIWHTNMDVYDHVRESNLIQMATVIAGIVYHTAMRDEKIPRKPLPRK